MFEITSNPNAKGGTSATYRTEYGDLNELMGEVSVALLSMLVSLERKEKMKPLELVSRFLIVTASIAGDVYRGQQAARELTPEQLFDAISATTGGKRSGNG